MDIDRLIREPERAHVTGIPRSSWYDLIDRGLAPGGVRLGRYAVAWPASELDALNRARIAGKSDDEIRRLVAKLVAARAAALDATAAGSRAAKAPRAGAGGAGDED